MDPGPPIAARGDQKAQPRCLAIRRSIRTTLSVEAVSIHPFGSGSIRSVGPSTRHSEFGAARLSVVKSSS
jgi:hypothetical protein